MYISTAIVGVYCNEMKIIIIKAQIPIMGMLVHIGGMVVLENAVTLHVQQWSASVTRSINRQYCMLQ